MDSFDYFKAQDKLVKELDYYRYNHSLGVSYTAASLALRYDINLYHKARIAGLLHDSAKRHKDDEFIDLCSNNGIEINEYEKLNPGLLHAKYSSYIAKNEFDITDNEILDSIICHTTGKPNMTLLDKIIYISDYMEPNRYKQKNLDIIRHTAFNDIDKALYMILNDTVDHLKKTNKVIDKTTEETYRFYKELLND